MTLKDNLNTGLGRVSSPGASEPFVLDENGICVLPVPMPPTLVRLADNRLMVRVEMAPTGNLFSLMTPLAVVGKTASTEFYKTLFYRQRRAEQVVGLSMALQSEDEKQDILVATYHWMLDAITPEEFAELFKKFTFGALVLIQEIVEMARRESAVKSLHKGRP